MVEFQSKTKIRNILLFVTKFFFEDTGN